MMTLSCKGSIDRFVRGLRYTPLEGMFSTTASKVVHILPRSEYKLVQQERAWPCVDSSARSQSGWLSMWPGGNKTVVFREHTTCFHFFWMIFKNVLVRLQRDRRRISCVSCKGNDCSHHKDTTTSEQPVKTLLDSPHRVNQYVLKLSNVNVTWILGQCYTARSNLSKYASRPTRKGRVATTIVGRWQCGKLLHNFEQPGRKIYKKN